MIDINELRRLAQAATPGPWIAAGPSFGESLPKHLNEVVVDREGDEDDGYSICNAPIGLNEERSDDMAFIAEANPLAIEELLDRLEAAEKSRDDLLACLGEWLDKTKWVQQGSNEGTISAKYLGLHRADVMSSLLGEAEKERDELRAELTDLRNSMTFRTSLIGRIEAEREDLHALIAAVKKQVNAEFRLRMKKEIECNALRAKIEKMERQGPVAWCTTDETGTFVEALGMNQSRRFDTPLYLAPGAQPTPSIPEGWKLVPIVSTAEMDNAGADHVDGHWNTAQAVWDAMLATAPEAKP